MRGTQARGNLTNDGTNAYGYDIHNRLTSRGANTLSYDPAGRLYETIGGGVTTRMLYDGVALIAEYNGSDVLQRRYVHGPAMDEPIVWYEGSGTSDRRWLIADERGSIAAITNGSGAATSINVYDEYGVPGSSNAGRFQYTGQQWIVEAGVYHYKARAYSPALGRFLQTDPIGIAGGINLYAYVGNDPVNFSDTLGLQEEEGEIVVTAPSCNEACQRRRAVEDALERLSRVVDTGGQSVRLCVGGQQGSLDWSRSCFDVPASSIGEITNDERLSLEFRQEAFRAVTNGYSNALWDQFVDLYWNWVIVPGATGGLGRAGYLSGFEVRIGRNFRVAPFGNRTGHPLGERPHYHRRIIDPITGETRPGGGIGWHRPWEKGW